MTLVTFLLDLERFERTLGDRMDELIVRTSLEMAKNVIVGDEFSPGTPVDTGLARGSWTVTLNDSLGLKGVTGEEDWDVLGDKAGALDPDGSATLAEVSVVCMQARRGDVVYILSAVVYMRKLEYGHSQQAPGGFVRLTAAAVPAIVARVAARMGSLSA